MQQQLNKIFLPRSPFLKGGLRGIKLTVMKIKFLRPVAGFAYFENDITDALPDEKAAGLVAKGYAILIPETEGEQNKLPDDLPGREQLYDGGLETIEDVKNALPTITDIKGIGKKTAEAIKKYLQ